MTMRPSVVPSFLEDLPLRFADFLAERTKATPEFWLGAALASQETLRGGVCLDLREIADRPWPEEEVHPDARAPELNAWMNALRGNPAVGAPGDERPLVLTGSGRLYLHRYWEYEDALARDLVRRATTRPQGIDLPRLTAAWAALPNRDQLSEGQRIAGVTAVLRSLAIISGGAGTGKTTIVTCLLKLLASQSDPDRPLRVRLAAPTGKAAGRLKEQLRAHRDALDPDGAIDRILCEEPATLHRLLGGVPGSTRFRHHADDPLPLDVLIIDETSMVDLAMMAKVVAALPDSARLVLIGDKDQLPPVGVGSVFGELCAAPPAPPPELRDEIEAVTGRAPTPPEDTADPAPIAASLTLLQHSFRFGADSGIGSLADAVRTGDGRALAKLVEDPPADLTWLTPSPDETADIHAQALERISAGFTPFLDAVRANASPAAVLESFNRFRLICVLRDGPSGVTGWNAAIESHLRSQRKIPTSRPWYEGRPVIVSRNDYGLRLWNGDIGVALRRPEDGLLRVYFEGASGGIRDFPPGRLSHVETAYALTVHKSQGSEFAEVLFALPEVDSRLLSRELLYTGVTRARDGLSVVGDPKRFGEGMVRRVPRASGLAESLGLSRHAAPAPSPPVPRAAEGPRQGELF